MKTINFEIRRTLTIRPEHVRQTLAKVRDQLLRHDINGDHKKFDMNVVCDHNKCGMAACIGGWVSIFMLGFEGLNDHDECITRNLFANLAGSNSRLNKLLYDYNQTEGYNEPNIAATAIQRFLDGERLPWPRGKMPNKLRYKRARKAK